MAVPAPDCAPNPASNTVAADLTLAFTRERSRLWGLAYRMTGCAADADDIVQDTFAKALASGLSLPVVQWQGWLTQVTAHAAIDVLRRRRRRGYSGSWLPSPIETADAENTDPAQRYSQLESISFAFLMALEALSPRQRAVLLLREVFDHSAASAGDLLGMSEGNVRVTHMRARRILDAAQQQPAAAATTAEMQRALAELLRGLMTQDTAAVEALLARDARAVTDAGGEFNALARPMLGAARVARLLLRVSARRSPGSHFVPCTLNGEPALAIVYGKAERRQAPRAVMRCQLDASGRIRELHVVLATRKLSHVAFER
ncbi:MAG TPA: sigma-70 family RNA polymerase sigma factor [Candidatus Binatia bacterium]|nr:sigma-70 family RNA polymerase sigma factor [Candidatus Binatia bacterium]